MNRRRQSLYALAAGAAAAISIVAAPTAQAQTVEPLARACANGEFCLYSNPGFGGTPGYFKFGAPDLRPFGLDNNASSARNNTGVPWCLYDGYNYNAVIIEVNPGAHSQLIVDNRAGSLRKGAC